MLELVTTDFISGVQTTYGPYKDGKSLVDLYKKKIKEPLAVQIFILPQTEDEERLEWALPRSKRL